MRTIVFRTCMAVVETEAECFVRGYHHLQRYLDCYYRRDLEKIHLNSACFSIRRQRDDRRKGARLRVLHMSERTRVYLSITLDSTNVTAWARGPTAKSAEIQMLDFTELLSSIFGRARALS